MQKIDWRFLPACALLVLVSCATPHRNERLGMGGELPWPPLPGQGYVAINLHVDPLGMGDVDAVGCVYEVEAVSVDPGPSPYGVGSRFDLPISTGKSVEAFALPAGRYEVQGFVCGHGRGSLETFRKSTFRIFAGKISYVGAWVIGEASATESQDADARLAEWTRRELPVPARSQVVSGYSEKGIPEEILMNGHHSPGLNLSFRKGANEAALSAFQKELGACAGAETQTHRFGLGRVSFEVRAKGGTRIDSIGSFSDSFTACVAAALKGVSSAVPGLKGEVK